MSSQERYQAIDRYFDALYTGSDSAPAAALANNQAAGLPAIDVSPTQGKLLQILARAQNARQILEIGTLGGYSTLWLASALPHDGHLITLEIDPKHAQVARANFAQAGLAERIELRLGPAIESLRSLEAEHSGPFDLVFIDADKANNPHYVTAALDLSRRGTLIIVDNVVRRGAVLDAGGTDPHVEGTRRVHELLAAEPRVSATAIQTVGSKGHDGFAIAVVIAEPRRTPCPIRSAV
jgi:predicted O-methyltransferase YrrM